jgi:holo-[acyl-carrier protein] synthase
VGNEFGGGQDVLRSGVDLIEIERIRRAVDRHGDRFLARVYTPREVVQSCGRMESLAGKFAAKEAAAKALGTGVWRNGIGWLDIEVYKDMASGAPELLLHGAAAARAAGLGLGIWSLSISHDRSHAIAFVIALPDLANLQASNKQQ